MEEVSYRRFEYSKGKLISIEDVPLEEGEAILNPEPPPNGAL